jgi:hypothetical protein
VRTRTLIAVIFCLSIHYALPQPAFAEDASCGRDIVLGEDDTRYYCLKRRIVDECKAKETGAGLDACIKAGCVGLAGTSLQKQRLACIDKNKMCLEDSGAVPALITAMTACLVGLASPFPGATCFAGAMGGSAVRDYYVNLCKSRYGDCMDPVVDEHKNQVKFCSSKPRI